MFLPLESLIFLLINLLKIVVSDETVHGCCGFITSKHETDELNFSLVKVKLLTPSGGTKIWTDAAPNGYYFVPLEHKGNYTLKVEPPPGWSFEPSSFPINYEGDNLCKEDNDLNFEFKGFGITGRVTTLSNEKTNKVINGPAGVTVSLFKDKIHQANLVGEKLTDNDGIYFFTPIQPGSYILTASHSVWKFEKSTADVVVREGNTELADGSLVVFGFDVNGKVLNEDNQPVSGVSLILYGNGKFKDCSTEKISNFDNYLCHVKSNEKGEFKFPALTNGNYKIVPYYADTNTKFVVEPSELSVKIHGNSVVLAKDFKITGFTVTGKVFMSKETTPVPVANAKIYLSGKHIATTDKNGHYSIEKMKSGQYTLKVDADNLKFDERTVRISSTSPSVANFYPSSYKVCGSVTHSAKDILNERSVIIENPKASFRREIKTDEKTGKYCLYLPPGEYQLNVVVNHEEKTKGLQFYPLQHTINIDKKPIDNINFLQLKATLTGTIECMKQSSIDCTQVSITLKVLDGITVKTINAINGKYEFTEVLPGHYEILVDTDIYCWDNPSQKISVTSERATIPVFKQTGFSVTFLSSHDSAVEYDEPGKSKKYAITLPAGSTRHCVTSPGKYEFIPKSCHVYSQEFYEWNTNNQSPIILTSNEHRHKGRIVVPVVGATSESDKQHDIRVQIEIENPPVAGHNDKIKNNNNKIIPAIVKKVANQGAYRYTFEFNGKADTTYIITPLSDIIIFNHASVKVIGKDDCNDDVASFNGHVGVIISGKIDPPMEDVTVKIFGNDKNLPIHTIITDKTGVYNIGPLSRTIDYSVTAEKHGYTIKGPSKDGTFIAHKLAEIIVQVNDEDSNTALQGVLLSLSGGDRGGYRKNSITTQQGQLVFNSLSPGDYYLRPMMKEYKFDTSSKIIKIKEGETLNILLSGKRVAFSVFGSVKSLNGEAESGVVIEAICNGDNCSNNQEEATTDDYGKFRIRGLEPNCLCNIRLKLNVQGNLHIQRSSPVSIDIRVGNNDTFGLEFIAFNPILRTDLSVHVKTEQPEYYRTLKLKLCREDQPDSPIHVVNVDQNAAQSGKFNAHYNPGFLVHFPSLQSNNKKYFLHLESTLSTALYKYKTVPIYFDTNSSFKAIEIKFNAERKIDNTEMNQSSMLVLPIILIVAISFIKRDILMQVFGFVVDKWSKSIPSISRPAVVQAVPIDPRADDIIVEQIMNINKRKTKPRKI